MRLFSAPGSSEAEIVNLFEICHVRLHVFTLFRKFNLRSGILYNDILKNIWYNTIG